MMPKVDIPVGYSISVTSYQDMFAYPEVKEIHGLEEYSVNFYLDVISNFEGNDKEFTDSQLLSFLISAADKYIESGSIAYYYYTNPFDARAIIEREFLGRPVGCSKSLNYCRAVLGVRVRYYESEVKDVSDKFINKVV